jgi:ABC-type bacteriocin/lantibiotic exporter with double-glycine peptidase domain
MKVVLESISFIYRLLSKNHRTSLFWVAFLLLVNSLFELMTLGTIIPIFLVLIDDNITEKEWVQWAFENFNLTDEKQLIVLMSIVLFLAFVFKNILTLWISKTQIAFSSKMFKELLKRMHINFYRRGFSFFNSTNSNEILRDISSATRKFSSSCVQSTIVLVNELVIVIFIIGVIAFYNIKIFLILIIAVAPVIILFSRWVKIKSLVLSDQTKENDYHIFKYLLESVHGYVDIIISGTENFFRKKLTDSVQRAVDISIKSGVYNVAPSKVIETTLIFSIALVLCVGIYIYPSKDEVLKLLALFVVAGYRIIPSTSKILIAINALNQSKWVYDTLEPLMDDDKKYVAKSNSPLHFTTSISVENIQFSFDSKKPPLFKDYSLSVKKGEVVGIMGPSGSGKTTLMNIMLGLIKPLKGVLKLDNQTITENNISKFHDKIGYVQQHVYMIDATLAENIAFGFSKNNIDLVKLKEVIDKARLTDFVNDLSEGVNTIIGENGALVSGGQKQRIGIARALYFDSEILFFDEATSALDDKTEQEITDAIENISDGELTIIIIAHRKTSLKNCTRIIEINNLKKT